MATKINIIRNDSQVKKHGRRSNGLCFINVPIEGNNLTKNVIENKKLLDITNLLGIQFPRLLKSYEKFSILDAQRLIEFQKENQNKIILVPLNCNSIEFQKLEMQFSSLYPNETYVLVLIGLEVRNKLYSLLKENIGNKLISSVEIIEHYRTESFTSNVNEIKIRCLCHNICVLIQEVFEQNIDLNLETCVNTISSV